MYTYYASNHINASVVQLHLELRTELHLFTVRKNKNAGKSLSNRMASTLEGYDILILRDPTT